MTTMAFFFFALAATAAEGLSTLVLGGGFAGTYTALQLSRLKPEMKITVVDERPRFTFLPLLYEYACNQISEDEVSADFNKLFAGTNVDFVCAQVESFDPSRRTARLKSGDELSGDATVLALGKRPLFDDIPEGALPFYRLEHAAELRRRLPEIQKCVVVGGGFTGVELACQLRSQKKDVVLVHRGKQLVPAASDANRKAAVAALSKLGVRVLLESTVVDGEQSEDSFLVVKSHTQKKEEELRGVDAAIWTAGTRLAAPLRELPEAYHALRSADGPLAVDAALRLRLPEGGPKNVFALGDAVRVPGPALQPSAQVALQQANVAARNVAAYFDNRPPIAFQYRNLGELLTLGPRDGAASLLGTVNLDGAVAGLARRLIYAVRMPTPVTRITSLAGLAAPPPSSFSQPPPDDC